MNMKQFRYVLVLSTEGSVSAAAAALGISQPSLSQYLKKIESEVNATLFDRSGSVLRLTDAGRVYIDAGKRILDIEHQMEGRIADINDYKSGTLTVGIAPYRAVYLMPRVVDRFRKKYPGIRVVVDERSGRELPEASEHGEFDLCVTTAPANEKLYNVEKIMDEEVVLAVPEGTRMQALDMKGRKYPAVDIHAIDGAQMITLSDTQIMQRTLNDICAGYDLRYHVTVDCRSIEAQLAMVRSGLGMALVPSGIDRSNRQGVNYYSIVQPLPRRDIVVIYRKELYLTGFMRDMIDILKTIED
ncbi:MAG: LysR family transcriptional regulator [Clostridia bacterium]|nr:LysR family transcriptional regulator [Clostridia bacterium]MBR6890137.1 LysR family transcriptional regulator [Clostridia bacterium]